MKGTPSQRLKDYQHHHPYPPPSHKPRSGFKFSFRGLCGCCKGIPMRPTEHEAQQEQEQAQPIRIEEAIGGGRGGRDTPEPEFDSVFTQLGPDDVSYKVRTQPKMVHQYSLGDSIGEGSYAKVREAFDTITNRRVAIKILTRRKLKKLPAGEAAVKKEVEVLSKLRHVNIVEHIDYFIIDEKEKIYIVLEYVGGGTLQDLIARSAGGIMPRRQAQLIFRQLLSAVEYIHSRNIVHCDIKPDNLMFSNDGVLKMTDFGVAEEIGLESDYEILTKSGGSPAFQPPEAKSGINTSSPVKIDIWAVGITLYIMITGKYPFSGSNIYTICDNISKGEYQLPESIELELATLIKGILQLNPGDRYSIQDMKNSSWVVNDVISDEPLLPYSGAPAASHHDIFADNHRVGGHQGYSSGSDYEEEEEPTIYTLDESVNSNFSSEITHHHKKISNPSNASHDSSMTNLPSTSLTHTPNPDSDSPKSSPSSRHKAKLSRCSIM